MRKLIPEKPSVNVRRVLSAFTDAMGHMLTVKPYEDITVGELCRLAEYPRSTFYNYFEDKDDLLNHLFTVLSRTVVFDRLDGVSPDQRVVVAFDAMYQFFDSHRHKVDMAITHNASGCLHRLFDDFVRREIREWVARCPQYSTMPIPADLLASHYATSILMTLRWIFVEGNDCDVNTAHMYLREIVSDEKSIVDFLAKHPSLIGPDVHASMG